MNTARSARFERDVDRLLDDHDRRAAAWIARTTSSSCADDRGREAERQLVDHEQLGPGHERAAEREHLLLAAGEVAGQLAASRCSRIGNSVSTSRLGARRRGPWSLRISHAGQPQVLGDGERREHALAAGHERRCRAGSSTSADSSVMSSPSNTTVPPLGPSSPQMPLSSVDLPAPLVPSRATISPRPTSKSTPKRICTRP